MMAQEPVRLSCASPSKHDVEGVIARVGADFIEMALAPCEPYSAYSNALAYKERGVRIIPHIPYMRYCDGQLVGFDFRHFAGGDGF